MFPILSIESYSISVQASRPQLSVEVAVPVGLLDQREAREVAAMMEYTLKRYQKATAECDPDQADLLKWLVLGVQSRQYVIRNIL